MFVGGAPARVLFAGLSPTFVGVYQINLEIPAGASVGEEVPVRIEIGGASSQDGVTIAVAR